MPEPEVTIVFPCLNEQQAIGACVDDAVAALRAGGLDGEVLVIDNGSEDRSAAIAEEHGARVVVEHRRGYGSAYLRGLQEARGEYVVMLDADGTYPAERIPDFVQALKDGAEIVVGNRFGGGMGKDAMPVLNRYLGNPILSGMTRLLYRTRLKDVHSGMRAIRRSVVPQLALQTPGMEFATEMIVKALDHGLRFAQLDIAYRPRVGLSKLNPVRDAWRHVEYMLVFSPVKLFLLPGLVFYLAGLAIQLVLLPGPLSLLRMWNLHTNVAGLAASLFGTTLLVLGIVSCAIAWSVQMRFRHSAVSRWVAQNGNAWARSYGILCVIVGATVWAVIFARWVLSGFGVLSALPLLTLATTLLTSGLELIGAAFLVHVIDLRR